MGKSVRILLHLAAVLAGWGMARSFLAPVADAAVVIPSGKASVRETRDREAAERLLRRLVPDLAPASPAEVVRHEGTLEERVKRKIEDDPFAEYLPEEYDEVALRHLRGEIQDTILGDDVPDFSYAFRHGRLEARRMLDTLREILPDLAEEALLPRAVFLELFEIEPKRAAGLIDGLDPAERTAWLKDGFLTRSEPNDPFEPTPPDQRDSPSVLLRWTDLAVLNQCEDMEMFSNRAMETLARRYRDQYGSDYTTWLFDQPPTKGREKLLNALASVLELDEPEAGVALKKRLSNR